jgi:hypothetical protein
MEDWAYAGAWENKKFVQYLRESPIKNCTPSTFGGYDYSHTDYSLRSLVYLVETALDKQPLEDELGSDENIFGLGKLIFILKRCQLLWTYSSEYASDCSFF